MIVKLKPDNNLTISLKEYRVIGDKEYLAIFSLSSLEKINSNV